MDIKCIFVVAFVVVLINQQEVDTRLEGYAIRLCESFDDINHVELFAFVLRNPRIVNKWLDSINLLLESNERRGIGKVYEVFIGKFSAYFTVTKFEDGKSITLETDSYFLFLSSFSITFHEACESSALQIQHRFNIKSMLFQNTIGMVLRKLLEQRLEEALRNLKITLCKLQAENILLY